MMNRVEMNENMVEQVNGGLDMQTGNLDNLIMDGSGSNTVSTMTWGEGGIPGFDNPSYYWPDDSYDTLLNLI